MQKITKLKYIDSIRGIAVLMVILVHTAQSIGTLKVIPGILPAYGQMGVQLFFVASAFTLCLSAQTRTTEENRWKKYAVRRVFRIAPAYYVGLAGYFLINVLEKWRSSGGFGLPERYTIVNVVSNVVFVHGFFEPANNNIVPGGWSIGTEMAFYVIFPILFLTYQRHAKRLIPSTLAVFTTSIFISLAVNKIIFWTTGHYVSNNNFLYYNLFNQLPVFAIGISYYFCWLNNVMKTSFLLDLILFMLLSFCSIALWHLQALWPGTFEYAFSIIPIVSGLSFVFLMEMFRKRDFLNVSLLARIGTVSYSMYLIHFVFAHNISRKIAPAIEPYIGGDLTLVILFLGTVLATFTFALVSEVVVEKPSINLGRSLVKKLA